MNTSTVKRSTVCAHACWIGSNLDRTTLSVVVPLWVGVLTTFVFERDVEEMGWWMMNALVLHLYRQTKMNDNA